MVSSQANCSSRGASLRHDDQAQACRAWRIPDPLWARLVPLLPARQPHPLECHWPRVDDRKAMDALVFVLRTSCPWGALDATGLCAHRAAHRRCQAGVEADVLVALWDQGQEA